MMPPSFSLGHSRGENGSAHPTRTPAQDSPLASESDQWIDSVLWGREDSSVAADVFASYSPQALINGSTEDYFSGSLNPLATTGINSIQVLPETTRSVWPSNSPPAAAIASLEPTSVEEPFPQQAWAGETDTESYGRDFFSPTIGPPNSGPPPQWFVTQMSRQSTDASSSSPSSPTYAKSMKAPAESILPIKAKARPQLRTASRKQRKTGSGTSVVSSTSIEVADEDNDADAEADVEAEADADAAPNAADEVRARRNHNIVEKQYRNRLNNQFERLLAALPPQRPQGGSGDGLDAGGFLEEDDKRISKAEVLDMATRRIKALESERQRLQMERAELLRGVESMRRGCPM